MFVKHRDYRKKGSFLILLLLVLSVYKMAYNAKLSSTRRSGIHGDKNGARMTSSRLEQWKSYEQLKRIREPVNGEVTIQRLVSTDNRLIKGLNLEIQSKPEIETPRGLTGEAKFKSRIEDTSNHTTANIPVIYDVWQLGPELKRIHNTLYHKQTNDSCIIRPVGAIILGVAKSGTHELLQFLSLHPKLKTNSDLPYWFYGYDDSHKSFIPCTFSDQIHLAKSDYAFFSKDVLTRLYNADKNLKLILIVREPVERLVSAYTFSYQQEQQNKQIFAYNISDIPEIDHVFVDKKSGKINQEQFDIQHSVYDVAMEFYLKIFTRDQLLVIDSSEFKNHPVTVLKRVEKLLGLEPVISNTYFKFNQEKKFYCLVSNQTMYCYGSDRGRAKLKDIKPETKQKLTDYFKPHNERFFQMIGQKFEW